jgi:hypothetical protein
VAVFSLLSKKAEVVGALADAIRPNPMALAGLSIQFFTTEVTSMAI